ncbi:MAG TPA: hypothetical protein ENG23_01170 [Methanomicrobia archaeon]|nr:hypothetical protein [Methanomicrobia archaeon]
MPKKEVIVDTNALLLPGEFGIDIFEELARLGYERAVVPRAVLNELDRLRQHPRLKGSERRAASLGFSLVLEYVRASASSASSASTGSSSGGRGCTVTIKEINENEEEEEERERERERERVSETDALILELALKRRAAVLTNDAELRRELSEAGVATVYLRGRSRLEERSR